MSRKKQNRTFPQITQNNAEVWRKNREILSNYKIANWKIDAGRWARAIDNGQLKMDNKEQKNAQVDEQEETMKSKPADLAERRRMKK